MSKKQNASTLRSEEELRKDAFYRELDKQVSESKNQEDAESKYVDRGSFEDQDAAPHYSKLTVLKEHSATLNSLYRSLFQNPYFAHIDIQEEYTNSKMTVMLSDSEVLETPIDFGNDCMVVPFKQSVEAPSASCPAQEL